MWKNPKGQYGYLKKQRNKEIVATIIMFGISLSLYFAGIITTHTNRNLLTLVAVLGCLPASKSAVSMIMYCKAGICSEKIYQAVSKVSDSLSHRYDLYLTSYSKNFQLSHVVMKNKNLIGFTEDPKFSEKECYTHLQNMFLKNGYKDITIKVYSDLDKYLDRIQAMKASDMEELPKLQENVLHLMENLSL